MYTDAAWGGCASFPIEPEGVTFRCTDVVIHGVILHAGTTRDAASARHAQSHTRIILGCSSCWSACFEHEQLDRARCATPRGSASRWPPRRPGTAAPRRGRCPPPPPGWRPRGPSQTHQRMLPVRAAAGTPSRPARTVQCTLESRRMLACIDHMACLWAVKLASERMPHSGCRTGTGTTHFSHKM